MYYLIEKYVEKPVLTNILQDRSFFTYPDISFCFTNPIYFPPLNTFHYSFLMKKYQEYKVYQETQHEFFTGMIKFGEYLFMQKNKTYTHPSWSAVISCNYLGLRCSHHNFIPRYLFPFGACYTFNSTSVEESDAQFRQHMTTNRELEVVIYKAVDIIPGTISDPFESVLMPSGILFMIHDKETWPQVRESYVLDGYSQIDLKIIHKVHLNVANRCRAVKNHYKYFDVFKKINESVYGKYSDCVFHNVQLEVAKQCKCQWPKMHVLAEFRNLPFCLDGSLKIEIIYDCFSRAYQNLDRGILDNCYLDDCEHTTYETVISQSKFPAMVERKTQKKWLQILSDLEKNELEYFGKSDLHLRALKTSKGYLSEALLNNDWTSLDEEFVERNFMMIKVIPTSMFIDRVEETEEYPISRLLSDIGGCVGLWVGASLITIFEFIDLVMDFAEARMIPRKQEYSKTNSEHPVQYSSKDLLHFNFKRNAKRKSSVYENISPAKATDPPDIKTCTKDSYFNTDVVKISNV